MTQDRLPDLERHKEFLHPLLPSRNELVPITDKNSTFGECYFDRDFDELETRDQLQVVADLLRQSILPDYYSDPDTEQLALVGDCHATSRLAEKYLRYLGVGTDYQYVMVNRRPFDPPEKTYSKHAILIVTDEEGERWQLDSAPWMGYGYGTVSKEGEDQLIDDYSVINDEELEALDAIKRLRVQVRRNKELSHADFEALFGQLLGYEEELGDHLRGFVGEGYAVLAAFCQDEDLKRTLVDKAVALDPYRGATQALWDYASDPSPAVEARDRLRDFTLAQCERWEAELQTLLEAHDPATLPRQLQLAQWIVNERKFVDASRTATALIDGVDIPITAMNPRFFAERGLNTAIIKPSADFIGVHSTIKEELRPLGVKAEYDFNPVDPTDDTGIMPLLFSHALADKFIRSYTGNNEVMLVSATSEHLYDLKQRIRSELGKRVLGKTVIWTDGEPIEWHRWSMNYLHTTDYPAEASLHYAFGKPEYSVMTRWMYPNRKLV